MKNYDESLKRREEESLTTKDLAQTGQNKDIDKNQTEGEVLPFRGQRTADTPTLLEKSEAVNMRTQWQEIQTAFVDEPRNAVERADKLVASAIQRLAQVFADERGKLETQWSRGDQISTEDLRVALQRYRTFFDRLLSI